MFLDLVPLFHLKDALLAIKAVAYDFVRPHKLIQLLLQVRILQLENGRMILERLQL